MIKQNSGEYNIEGYKKTASTPFTNGDVVAVTAGLLVLATGATAVADILGQIQRDVLATDDDYADETVVAVNVFDNNSNEFKATVEVGSAVQSMVGGIYNLNTEDGLNVSLQTLPVFRITRVISATEVVGRFVNGS